MVEAYKAIIAEGRPLAETAAAQTGWAWNEQLLPGRVYDHGPALPLDQWYAESAGVRLGEFGDTVVWQVESDADYERMNRLVGVGQPVVAELVQTEVVRLSYVDRTAGIERLVELGPGATRAAVREAASGELLPFEEQFLDGPAEEEFPRVPYLIEARLWLFALGHQRSAQPAARMIRGYQLGPVDGPPPLVDGRPEVEL